MGKDKYGSKRTGSQALNYTVKAGRRILAGKKIGLFGGTFNPIHLGHLRGAEEIRESFGLDQVVFIPSATPPHKAAEEVIEPEFRLEMVKRAIRTNPFFSVSEIELERQGKSYSIDTLRHFHEGDPDSLFFFIVGNDAFIEIETWKDHPRLFALANFIVMARPGFGETTLSLQLPGVLASSFHFDRGAGCWVHRSGHTIHFREITFLDVSSTKIREWVEKGRSVKYIIPSQVEGYIQEQGLYRQRRVG